MPRISRNSLNSNFFHVTVQGINKEHIFYNNSYKAVGKQPHPTY